MPGSSLYRPKARPIQFGSTLAWPGLAHSYCLLYSLSTTPLKQPIKQTRRQVSLCLCIQGIKKRTRHPHLLLQKNIPCHFPLAPHLDSWPVSNLRKSRLAVDHTGPPHPQMSLSNTCRPRSYWQPSPTCGSISVLNSSSQPTLQSQPSINQSKPRMSTRLWVVPSFPETRTWYMTRVWPFVLSSL